MAVKLSSLSFLGLAVETVVGTPVASTGYLPVQTFKPQDTPTYVPDTGMRGQPVTTFGEYLGPISSTYEIGGGFYPTAAGNLLANVLGTDTVSGTAAPYTHTLTVAATPGSLTVGDNYVANYRQWPGMKVDKMVLKFTPEAGLTHTTDLIGWPSESATAPTGVTFGTSPYFLGWEASLSLNGSTDAQLNDATITIQRDKAKALFSAQNSQKPFDTFVGAMAVTWELTFYMESDTEYSLALSQQGVPVILTFTQPGTDYQLILQSSKVQFTKPTINRSQEFVEVSLEGTAYYNSTDSGVLLAKLINGVNTPYTTTAAS